MKRTLFNFIGTFSLIFLPYIGLGQKLSQYVDPFIGTVGSDYVSQGAALPFGMVQLGPYMEIGKQNSGQQASKKSILGFSHTKLGGLLVMPYAGDWKTRPVGSDAVYRASIEASSEIAQPGYYSVLLGDAGIKAELTATLRTGFHKYTFPASSRPNIVIDFGSDADIKNSVQVIGNNEVTGSSEFNGKHLFFVARFSKPFSGIDSSKRGESKILFHFESSKGGEIMLKVGVSQVSIAAARKNMQTEINHWNFDKVRETALEMWETELSKIETEGGTAAQKTQFYTALYRTLLQPNIAMDVDGKYRGTDNKIHTATNFNYYNPASLQGSFHTLAPLFELIYPKVNTDIIQSLLMKYQQSGKLSLSESIVVSSLLINGGKVTNKDDVYKSLINNMKNNLYFNTYKEYAYVPSGMDNASVSKTIKYAYNDWCIAQLAKMLENEEDYKQYLIRSLGYRNLFDSLSNSIRARDRYGVWEKGITENRLGQAAFFPMHDINGLTDLMGGKKIFVEKLDSLFARQSIDNKALDNKGINLGGRHSLSYLYNYVGQPWKAQSKVRYIMDKVYKTESGSIIGNSNLSQLSAWYVYSAMGFYPVNPASGQLALGSPLFEEIIINLSNGEKFEIEAKNANQVNKYIQYAEFNRSLYSRSYINLKNIENGGKLFLKMVGVPSYEWAIQPSQQAFERAVPKGQDITPKENVFMPYDSTLTRVFQGAKQITLKSETPAADIHYSLNAVTPSRHTAKYTSPIKITESQRLKAIAIKDSVKSEINEINYVRAYLDASISSGDGKESIDLLTDGELRDSRYSFEDAFALQGDSTMFNIDLGVKRPVKNIILSFRSNKMPRKGVIMSFQVKTVGTEVTESLKKVFDHTSGMVVPNRMIKIHLPINKSARFFQLVLKNLTKESGVQLYLDEIMLEY